MTLSYYRYFGEANIANGDIVGTELFCVFFDGVAQENRYFAKGYLIVLGKRLVGHLHLHLCMENDALSLDALRGRIRSDSSPAGAPRARR